MKTLLLLLLLAFGIHANAQVYEPMLKDGRVWKVVSPSVFSHSPDVSFTISESATLSSMASDARKFSKSATWMRRAWKPSLSLSNLF